MYRSALKAGQILVLLVIALAVTAAPAAAQSYGYGGSYYQTAPPNYYIQPNVTYYGGINPYFANTYQIPYYHIHGSYGHYTGARPSYGYYGGGIPANFVPYDYAPPSVTFYPNYPSSYGYGGYGYGTRP
jgi:hypothetical protein